VSRLLLVEDDLGQCELYHDELVDAGYEVVVVHDGRAALKQVQSQHFDAVILDLNMPGMDGLDAMGKILDQDPKTPIIINTAYTGYKEHFMTWAADAYVVKSSDLSELLDAVADAVSKGD